MTTFGKEVMSENTVKTLKRRLRDGQHTIILANRTVDKAPIIFSAVEQYKSEEDITIIHIDLWEVNYFCEAAINLIDSYLLEEKLSIPKPDITNGGSSLINLISFILEREQLLGRRVLLYIDEFQKLSEFDDMSVSESEGISLTPGSVFLRRLRTLIQSQTVTLFATGSDASLIDLFSQYHAPFYKAAMPLIIRGDEE
ncbi:ATP-binding protein [Hydrogenovibrio kuenenii]|uniref:hypothetical protein n=1 Tax=Hydrogenovibrio kuenenii TaxID=63658 RepID=UPI000466FE19|nr:hypothetical protein [Hydrogenovibrio kuenenii]